jgi:hypothetical protein
MLYANRSAADVYLNSTPYHYVLNNPVKYVDPTGMFTELFDNNGNKIGEDENGNDGNVSIISDKKEAKRIKKNTKAGQIASADDVASGVQTTKGVLTEALDVLARTEANGGLREEVSVVKPEGEVIRCETGPEPKIENVGGINVQTAETKVPEVQDGIRKSSLTLIHSHPLEIVLQNGEAFPQSDNRPSSADKSAFKGFGTNIIMGPIGVITNITRSPNGTINVPSRPNGAVIYNSQKKQQAQIKSKALKHIIK